ncbi:hypothetical protein B296_00002431 [Ensete ventricosum]|uniref:Uncharacterized protein n=1 Tax=Ensete ventricosum TaxID=4639 RepID=A0A426ZZB5_ENSVE|nr:hypothetical protein B296_00002431 [Ensete ventricosum]
MLQRTPISENKTGEGPASQNLQKIGSEERENELETMKAAREGILEGGGERGGALETEQEGKRQHSPSTMFCWTTAGLVLSVICSSIGDLVGVVNDFHVVL